MKVLKISNPSGSFNYITLMAEGFAKYSAGNFVKKLDKFRSKRVGTVGKIRHLVMERAPYDLLKFRIAEVKELQHVRKLNLNFRLSSIFNTAYSLTSTLKICRDTQNGQKI